MTEIFVTVIQFVDGVLQVKIWFALACFLFLTSCTQQRIAIRFADTMVGWTADDYFDLTSAQKDSVKKEFNTFVKNTYENDDQEIPKILDHAELILSKTTETVKADCSEIQKVGTQTGTIVPKLAKLSAVHIQKLLETLSEKQILYFVGQVSEKLEEDERQLKNLDNREERRFQRTLDNLRSFFGNLSTEQEAALRRHMKANPFPFEEQFNNKKANFQKLKTASGKPESFRVFVLDYVQNWRSHQSVAYLKTADELRSQNVRFYQNFVCEASIKQIKFLRQKLSGIKSDFEEFFIHGKSGRI